MATPVIMPRQGQSVESCIISEWFVKKGDKVKVGDLLFSYETDKAAFEEESKDDGIVLDIFFNAGSDVPVLTNVCVIGIAGESIDEFIPDDVTPSVLACQASEVQPEPRLNDFDFSEKSEPQNTEDTRETQGFGQIANEEFSEPENMHISPRAKNLAEKTGADLRFAKASGPEDRVIERDVRELQKQGLLVTKGAMEDYIKLTQPVSGSGLGGRVTTRDLDTTAASGTSVTPATSVIPATSATETTPATPGTPVTPLAPGASVTPATPVITGSSEVIPDAPVYQDIKLSNIRKIIGRTMHESLSQMAQLTLNISFDATDIMQFRQQLKKNADKLGLTNITINDILVYAVSRVLPQHKYINANFSGDTIRSFTNVNMGVAVDTDRGLMVPTLFNANKKSLNEIAIETKELAELCRKGTINPDNLKDGTFTITNLGTFGIESFTPVINPPQTAILGVNTIEQKSREKDGDIKAYSSMSLSLTFDHRAVDGAPAARFLKDVKDSLEHFMVIMAKG